MKKLLLVTLIFLPLLIFSENLSVSYKFDDFSLETTDNFQILRINNCKMKGKGGKPLLPYHPIKILLPPGHTASKYKFVRENPIKIKLDKLIKPAKLPRPISKIKDKEKFFNTKIYDSKESFPQVYHTTPNTHFFNGTSFAIGNFTPVTYNPSKKYIILYQNIELTVETQLDDKAQNSLNLLNLNEPNRRIINSFAQNPQLINYYQELEERNVAKNIIITGEQFENDYDALKNHYLKKGYLTEIKTVESIENEYGTYPDTPAKIREFIIDQAADFNIGHVLLAGDVQTVPYRGLYCEVESSSIYEDYDIPADLYYAALDGNWDDNENGVWGEPGEADLLPDLSIGRISFNSQTELEIIINKTISYQTNPVLNELRDPLLVGEHLWDNPETWGGDYLDLLIGYQDDNGYATNGIPSDFDIHYLYDRDLGSWTSSELITAINSGKSFIHHSGHSSSDYNMRLYLTDISNSNFSEVDGNNHNFTHLYSHGCYSASFDVNDCIAEKMINIDNLAVSYIGNSRYGWFIEGSTEGGSQHLHREFIDALYTDKFEQIGISQQKSKIETAPWVDPEDEHEPGAQRWCFYDCNLLGDPAMSIWTDEAIMPEITVQEEISINADELSVTATYLNMPLENINCIILKQNNIIGKSLTDASGEATIDISAINSLGNIKLFTSGYNCFLDSVDIEVIPADGPYLTITDFEFSDNNNNVPNNNENGYLSLEISNIGNSDASDFMLNISGENEQIEFLTDSLQLNNLEPDESLYLEDAVEVSIDNGIIDQTEINIWLNLDNEDTSFTYEKQITINSPLLSIPQYSIDDSDFNDNSILEPGETAEINMSLVNRGHNSTSGGQFELTSDNPEAEILTEIQAFDLIDTTETINIGFNIEISENMIIGDSLQLFGTVSYDDAAYQLNKTFILNIGQYIEDFESGDFSYMDWNFSGAADWTISANSFEGSFSAKSGNIDNNSESTLSLSINVLQADTLSFYHAVSSEEGYDFLKFYIDGVQEGSWSGESQWNSSSYELLAGNHDLEWTFAKDQYVSDGDDCAWIDYIKFPPLQGQTGNIVSDLSFEKSKLIGNYPNPFNPTTTISFRIPTESKIEIVVFNIKGQKVRSLTDRSYQAGIHQIKWNGKDLNNNAVSSGVYFYKFNVNNRTEDIRKCILLK